MLARLLPGALSLAIVTDASIPSKVVPPPEGDLYRVECVVSRNTEKDPVLLNSKATMRSDRSTSFERRGGRTGEYMKLNVEVHPRPDGRLLADIRWEESDHDGEGLQWSPEVEIHRGEASTAAVEWGGRDRRTISITVR